MVDKANLVSKIFFGVFWITAVSPFIGQELVPSVYESISSYISLLADAVLILLGVWLIRSKTDWIMLVSFFVLAFISTYIFNHLSIVYMLNGIRLYIGFLFVIPILRYFLENPILRQPFIEKMDKTLCLFLWIQVPCMSYQCIMYGAYDQVGGSLGWMMSGVITTLIYLISLYLMLKRWDTQKSYFKNLYDNWVLVFLLFPSFLNETKISFVFLAMYFFFLIPMDKKFVKRLVYILPVIFIALVGALYLYYTATGSDDDIISEDYISFYLHGDEDSLNLVELAFEGDAMDTVEEQGNDFARGLKLAVIPWMFQTKDYATLFGFGVSQFKGGTMVERTEFYKEYEWILKGTELQLQAWLLDMGVLGLMWSIFFWVVSFKLFKKCKRHYQIQVYMLIVVMLTSIYNNCFTILQFCVIFLYLTMLSSDRKDIENRVQENLESKNI